MDFTRETEVFVSAFHYDINEEPKVKNQVNIGLKKAIKSNEDGTSDPGQDGNYYELGVVFSVAPAPGDFEVSGAVSQIVHLKDYYGDGSDLDKSDYKLLFRPLMEQIETLTYEVTAITLDEPVNLNFQPNF